MVGVLVGVLPDRKVGLPLQQSQPGCCQRINPRSCEGALASRPVLESGSGDVLGAACDKALPIPEPQPAITAAKAQAAWQMYKDLTVCILGTETDSMAHCLLAHVYVQRPNMYLCTLSLFRTL